MRDCEKRPNQPGLTRRGFLAFMGGSAATACLAAGVSGGEKGIPRQEDPAGEMMHLRLLVNGEVHRMLIEPRWTLLYVLRDCMGLTGTKIGCERGECGACTVLIDDLPHYACMTLALEAEGRRITTLEGIMRGEALGEVQEAFLTEDAFQCGYCTPGQIMAVEGLLRHSPAPSPPEIQRGTSGNLCRCGAYPHIFKAARKASRMRNQHRSGK